MMRRSPFFSDSEEDSDEEEVEQRVPSTNIGKKMHQLWHAGGADRVQKMAEELVNLIGRRGAKICTLLLSDNTQYV